MTDSRFFPGYIWTCWHEDCKLGLHFKTDDERQAAMKLLSTKWNWYNRGRTFTVWTMRDANSVPTRHDITVTLE